MLATVGAVLGILVVISGAIGTVLFWRARCTADVRRVGVRIRKVFDDAVALGGLESSDFMKPDAQEAEQELDDLIGRLNDRKLRVRCERLLTTYRQTFGAAPGAATPRVYRIGMAPRPEYAEEDRQRAEAKQQEVEHAEAGQAIVREVMDRVNALERFLPRRD